MADAVQKESRITVQYTFFGADGTTPLDISTTTVRNLYLKPHGGTEVLYQAADGVAFGTDGTDGVLVYSTDDDDLGSDGIWLAQFAVDVPSGFGGRGKVIEFRVRKNIEEF